MRPHILLLSTIIATIRAQQFELDCTNCPQSCNNDCYAVYAAGKSFTLNWDVPDTDTTNARRNAAGCTQGNGYSVCSSTNGVSPYNGSGDSCDEYPYASVTQGGDGAILRCVDQSDNSSEGSQLNNFYNADTPDGCGGAACQFTIFVSNYDNSPFCVNDGGANDGYEFTFSNGQYIDARSTKIIRSGYDQVAPDPALFIPLSQRREFLLDNGRKVLALTRDMDIQLNGTRVIGDKGSATIVRELLGEEKSLPFR